jgi:putative flippase GtrA
MLRAGRLAAAPFIHMKSRVQLIRFSLVGNLNTILHTATIGLVVNVFALSQLISNAVAYVVASSFSFVINSVCSLEVKPHLYRYSRFELVALLRLAASAILGRMGDILRWLYAITIFLTALIVPFISFLVHRRYTFSP